MLTPVLPSQHVLVLHYRLQQLSAELTVKSVNRLPLLLYKTPNWQSSLKWSQQLTTIGRSAQSITPWVKSYWLTLMTKRSSGLRLPKLLRVLPTFLNGQTMFRPKREKLSHLTLPAFPRTVSHGGRATHRQCLMKDKLYPTLSLQ